MRFNVKIAILLFACEFNAPKLEFICDNEEVCVPMNVEQGLVRLDDIRQHLFRNNRKPAGSREAWERYSGIMQGYFELHNAQGPVPPQLNVQQDMRINIYIVPSEFRPVTGPDGRRNAYVAAPGTGENLEHTGTFLDDLQPEHVLVALAYCSLLLRRMQI